LPLPFGAIDATSAAMAVAPSVDVAWALRLDFGFA
jgi:hypothetical protein